MLVSREVEIVQREVAHLRRRQRRQHALPAALIQERLVAQQHIAGTHRGAELNLGQKALRRGEARRQAHATGWQIHDRRLGIRTTPAYRLTSGLGEVARKPLHRGWIFPDKPAEILGRLVLLAKRSASFW